MAGRVASQIQHHHRIVSEHVAVGVDFLQFPSATEPMREGLPQSSLHRVSAARDAWMIDMSYFNAISGFARCEE